MLYVNLLPVNVGHFPDGTQALFDFKVQQIPNQPYMCDIFWRYENDEECMTLWYIVNHIKEYDPQAKITLSMLYCPNARMDRTKNSGEVFTLKYFAKFINILGFNKVMVLDPHSTVTPALLDRVEVLSPESNIEKALDIAFEDVDDYEDAVVYFPDAGAMKRYSDLKIFKRYTMIYGEKKRAWKTGEILGLRIMDRDGNAICDTSNELKGKTVLMIDDIISYGGTFYHSANKLNELGVKEIFAYATHTENSMLDKEKGTFFKHLESGVVTKLFTTSSLLKEKNSKIVFV